MLEDEPFAGSEGTEMRPVGLEVVFDDRFSAAVFIFGGGTRASAAPMSCPKRVARRRGTARKGVYDRV